MNRDVVARVGTMLLIHISDAAALSELEKLVQRNNSFSDAWFYYGRALEVDGDRKSVIQAWNQSLKLDPLNPRLLNLNPQGYDQRVDQIFWRELESRHGLLLAADTSYQRGLYLEAADRYQKLGKRLGSASFRLNSRLGLVMLKLERDAVAENYFRRSIEQNSRYYPAYYNMGLLYLKQRNFEKARHQLKLALQIKSNYEPAARLLFEIKRELSPLIQQNEVEKSIFSGRINR